MVKMRGSWGDGCGQGELWSGCGGGCGQGELWSGCGG